MDESELPIVERRGAVQWITLNRPRLRNALNAMVIDRIGSAIAEADADDRVRAVVLTGAGDKAFSAGADLRPDADGSPFDSDPEKPDHPATRLFRTVSRARVPIVARVNGDAMAGGVALLSACDLAVAADHARIATPEVKIGIFPLLVLPYLMPTVPRKRLMEMTLTGEPLTAEEAREAGLVNYVVPAAELDAKLDWLLGRLIDKSPTGIGLGKYYLNAMADMSFHQRLDFADTAFPDLTATEDCVEGLAAFNEKRKPVWPGR